MNKLMVIMMTLFLLAPLPAYPAGNNPNKARVGKPFIAIDAGNNGIFDRQTLDFITAHDGLVRLDIPIEGRAKGTFSYAQIVSRLHTGNPELPVLMYTHSLWWMKGKHTIPRIAHAIWKGHGQLKRHSAMETRRKRPPRRGHRVFMANPESSYFRHWIIGRIERYLELTGADGIALDATHRTPSFIHGKCKRDAAECGQYHHGIQSLLASLKKAIRPNMVYFNGLWNRAPGQLSDQLKLLPFADGATIEFFGRDPHRPVPPFAKGIKPFLKIISSHPDKGFMVNGRGSLRYTSYKADYYWQRYLYAAYLLVAGPRTHFHYKSGFTVPSHGRANAMAWYADWDIPLGKPLGPYGKKNDLYIRKFLRALVLIVPSDAKPARYTLDGHWYTPEGEAVSGIITVAPGQGRLLSKTKPQLTRNTRIDFDAQEPPGSAWSGAEVKASSRVDSYLALSKLPKHEAWRHDLMLDFKHSLDAPRCVHLKLRSHDKSRRVFLVTAVDDKKEEDEQAIVELTPKGSKEKSRRGLAIRFRDPRPYGRMPYLVSRVLPPADGNWHKVTVCAKNAFSGQKRYRFHQWQYVRIKGALNLAYVHVNDAPKAQ